MKKFLLIACAVVGIYLVPYFTPQAHEREVVSPVTETGPETDFFDTKGLPKPRDTPSLEPREEKANSPLEGVLDQLQAHLTNRQFREARKLLQQSLERFPNDPALSTELAILEADVYKKQKKAILVLENTLEEHPYYTPALETLVNLYEATGKRANALSFLESLPTDSQASAAIADLHLRWGDAEEAVDQLENGKKSDPSLKGAAYLRTGRAEEAIEQFNKARKRELDAYNENPADPTALNWAELDLAHAKITMGDFEGARFFIDSVLSRSPNSEDALELRGKLPAE